MSVKSELEKLRTNIDAAYDTVEEKGGTVPAQRTTANLVSSIKSITGGSEYGVTVEAFVGQTDADGRYTAPSAPLEITFDGVKSVGSGAMRNYLRCDDKNRTASFSYPDLESVESGAFDSAFRTCQCKLSVDFPNLSSVGSSAFSNAFASTTNLTSLSFPSVTVLDQIRAMDLMCSGSVGLKEVHFDSLEAVTAEGCLNSAFRSCSNLEVATFPKLKTVSGRLGMQSIFSLDAKLASVDFPELENVSGDNAFNQAFSSCSKLSHIGFPKLKYISGTQAFYQSFPRCTNLKSIEFPSLKGIGNTEGYMCGNVFATAFKETQIQSLNFPELEYIIQDSLWGVCGCFAENPTLKRLYFPKLRWIYDATMLAGCSVTEIHFSAEHKDDIEGSDGYGTVWGQGAETAQVFFDL